MRKLLWLIVAVVGLSVSSLGQTNSTASRTTEPYRSNLLKQMRQDAKAFDLDLDGDSLTVHSAADTLVAVTSVARGARASRDEMRWGLDVGFIRLESTRRLQIRNGSYRIEISAGRGWRRQPTASLIDREGRVVKQLRVTPVEAQPSVVGADCWVGGTHGVCFSAGTTLFQIYLWEIFTAI